MKIDNQLSPFELMPSLVIGNVLIQLIQMTEKKEVIQNFINLSLTSKTMAMNLDDLGVMKIFLKSLSIKYGKSQEYFACSFQTNGTNEWMWSYIKNNGYDKDYQIIQNIYELAANVSQEAKDAGLYFDFSEGRLIWPKPISSFDQTKQGFALYNDLGPAYLATPFGQIKIYGSGSYFHISPLSVAEVFIKRLNAIFLKTLSSKGRFYEIATPANFNHIRKIDIEEQKKISKKELKSRIGTQNLIVNYDSGNYGIYKVRQVNGENVPELIWHDSSKNFLCNKVVMRMWEMLEEKRLRSNKNAL